MQERRDLNEDLIGRIAKAAAEAAVKESFKKIGLNIDDEKTGKDIMDLRALMTAWRTAKNAAFIELVKMVVHVGIMAAATYAMIKLHVFGGGNAGN